MEYDPQKILKKFEEITKSSAKDTLVQWWQQYEFNINRLKSALNAINIDLSQSQRWKSSPENFWSDIRPSILRLQQWPRNFHILEEEISLNDLAGKYISQFEHILADIPTEIRILISEFYWQTSPEDRFLTLMRKKLQPVKYRFEEYIFKFINIFRAVTQKPPARKPSDERIIDLHDFIRFYLALPYCAYLRDEWQQYMQSIFGQFFIVQNKTDELIQKLLLLEKMESILESESENIFDELYAMADIIREVEITLESLGDYEKQFLYRLKNFWQDTSLKFEAAWARAGTFQLPGQRFSAQELEAKRYKLENRLNRDFGFWQNQTRGFLGEWSKNLDLTILAFNTIELVVQSIRKIAKNVTSLVNPEIRTASTQVNKLNTQIDDVINSTKLQELYETQLVEFSRTRFSQLLDAVSSAGLTNLVSDTLNLGENFINNISTGTTIFLHRDTANIPPRSKTREVLLSDLIRFTALDQYQSDNCQLDNDLHTRQEEIFRNISQLGQLVEFQFETAMHLNKDTGPDEPIDESKLIIRDTLDKTDHLLSQIINSIDETVETTTRDMTHNLKSFCTKIISLTERENIFSELHKQSRQQKKRVRNKLTQKMFVSLRLVIYNIIAAPLKSLAKILKAYYSYTKPEISVTNSRTIQDNVVHFLTETREKISRLPYIYQKLFLFAPLNDERFYSAPQDAIRTLSAEITSWQDGKQGMVAITGEMGSGKTTLVNIACQDILSGQNIVIIKTAAVADSEKQICQILAQSFGFKNLSSFHELEQAVIKRGGHTVCILDSLNSIFPKSVSGLELLEKLLDFLVRTQNHIFWLVTCSLYSWHYLTKVVNIEKYFRSIIRLGAISVNEIEMIILNRHRLSGFDLHFDANGKTRQDKKYKKIAREDLRQTYLQKNFFQKLNQISAGNVTIAMLFWLRSIREISGDRVILDTLIDFDYSFLQNLDDSELFTLAAITNYEKLTVSDHAEIFNQSVDLSSLNLDQMSRYGLLVTQGDYYHIHPFLYRHLVELLRSKNILH